MKSYKVALSLCLMATFASALPLSAAGPFKFKSGQSWDVEQSMNYGTVSNKMTMKTKVSKVNKDGSALLELSAGPQIPTTFNLVTPEGRVYIVSGEERNLMDWYKVPAEQIAVGKTIKMKDPDEESWTVTRLKDESLQSVGCEVYEAKSGRGGTPISELTWFSRKDGFWIKRKLMQGGEQPVLIEQSRLIKGK